MFLVPEEREPQDSTEPRKAFSSPQERTDFLENDSPFGRSSSKQRNLSQCLLLGPQNLNKIFDNRQIIEHSETLFIRTGYLTREISPKRKNLVLHNSILADVRTVEDVVNDLNTESTRMDNDNYVIELLNELYEFMDRENLKGSKIGSKLKIHILKGLYRFVESQNEQVLLSIARVILGVSHIKTSSKLTLHIDPKDDTNAICLTTTLDSTLGAALVVSRFVSVLSKEFVPTHANAGNRFTYLLANNVRF